MRSQPSAADVALIAQLEDQDIPVSPTQLERWRSLGMLPRAKVIREGFGGTQVLPHEPEVIDAAAFLGQVSRRSRPWQHCAVLLFDAGFPLSARALRGTATFLVQRQIRPMRSAWTAAESEASPAEDPDEELAEIGERAAAMVPRSVWAMVRAEVGAVHPFASAREIREYTDRAMTWRLVDLNVPGRMTDVQRNLARHGVEDPMPVLGEYGVFPLPSEREVVARTLSWGEAEVYREFAFALPEEDPSLAALGGPFAWMTWVVTTERRNEQPDKLDLPLPQHHLDAARSRLEQLAADMTTVAVDAAPAALSHEPG